LWYSFTSAVANVVVGVTNETTVTKAAVGNISHRVLILANNDVTSQAIPSLPCLLMGHSVAFAQQVSQPPSSLMEESSLCENFAAALSTTTTTPSMMLWHE
jgi:hypothetical protein